MDNIGPVVIDQLHIINDLDARRLEQELHPNLTCGADPVATQGPLQEEIVLILKNCEINQATKQSLPVDR
jgi:hypothetical protein